MIRVGLIGLGGITYSHLNGYKEIEGVTLVAAADIRGSEAKNAHIAEELGAKIYTSVYDMLDNEELDMVDICTPTESHAEFVKLALSRGLHVLSEKPMAMNYKECEELYALSEKSDKLYMVAHVVRFMQPYRYLASVIKSGELGRPVHIMMRRLSKTPGWSWQNWMQDPKRSGGAPLDLSIHDIDFIYSIFGEPKDVNAVYREFSGYDASGLNDYIVSNLIYDGFDVTITGGQYNADFPFTADYFALFEGGTVELKGGKVYRCGEEINLEEAKASESTGINVSSSGAYTDEIAYFISSIEKGERPDFVTVESSMGSIKLVERLKACAKKINV